MGLVPTQLVGKAFEENIEEIVIKKEATVIKKKAIGIEKITAISVLSITAQRHAWD